MDPDKCLSRSHLVEVKNAPSGLKNGSKWDQLSERIWDKFILSQQTESVYRKKIALWKTLINLIQKENPTYKLYVVGSTITGFATKHSDIDICLVSGTDVYSFLATQHLHVVHRIVTKSNDFTAIEMVNAKVPILKFRYCDYNMEVDLNCNNIVGIRNTHLIYSYAQLDWRVRPLIVIIKLWAQQNNINDPKNNTISSYSLVLMVINYLQCGAEPCVLPNLQELYSDRYNSYRKLDQIDMFSNIPTYTSRNQQTLGELFYGFLCYYSKFDYDAHAISVRLAKKIPRYQTSANHRRQKLIIEEPFDKTNTARSVYETMVFYRVKQTFKDSASRLDEGSITSVLR